jgi:hypothetical protein
MLPVSGGFLSSRPLHLSFDSIPDLSIHLTFRVKTPMEKNQDSDPLTSRRSEKDPQTREKEETFSLSRYLISILEKRR